ncbi:MAG: plasmid pRiA4b ORF-3 family protein [Clostridiales bacterium]|jgi:hypothetical protein|nr:plasmid pRiA4b ORF-3 family protein [Clostridiales bacterium]MDR2751009.1 plasmid pRiA4b ORF-3 family protein [Clostridiales bacterium]
MIVHITMNLAKATGSKRLLASPPTVEGLFSWRANYYMYGGRHPFLFFMNDETRFVLAINNPGQKEFGNLEAAFFDTLRDTLLSNSINPLVIDNYISQCGKFELAQNKDRKATGLMNSKAKDVKQKQHWFYGAIGLSLGASGSLYLDEDERKISSSALDFFARLDNCGLSLYNGTFFELELKLELADGYATRVVKVSAALTFEQLIAIISAAYGWRGAKTYIFEIFPQSGPSYLLEREAVCSATLSTRIPECKSITCHYGVGWRIFVKHLRTLENASYSCPTLASGDGDAPTYSMLYPAEYDDFLKARSDPRHPSYEYVQSAANVGYWMPFELDSAKRDVFTSLCLN